MTEDEARIWIGKTFGVSRETLTAAFIDMVVAENARQNLISKSSIAEIWTRHIVDSAQLLMFDHVTEKGGLWVDVGTGAGFPGMLVALLGNRPVMLVEPRKRRAAFLQEAAKTLGLADLVTVCARRVEQLDVRADVISARAVATISALFEAAHAIAVPQTVWILPKGANAREEVAVARRTWHGTFHVEPSMTQPGSLIVIATDVTRR